MNRDAKIGNRLKAYRVEKQMKQKDLAEILGIKPQQLAMYESGTRVPRPEKLQDMADAMGVALEYLLPPDSFTGQMDFELLAIEDMQKKLPRGFEIIPEQDLGHVILKFPHPDKTMLRVSTDSITRIVDDVMDYMAYKLNGLKGN